MQLFLSEVRRLLKNRSTWILCMAAFVLSIAMAVLVISFARHYYLDESGEEQVVTGTAAIEKKQEELAILEGKIAPKDIYAAFEKYQQLYQSYGSIDNFSLEVYYEDYYPIETILYLVQEVFVDEETGIPLELHEIAPEKAATFYQQRDKRLEKYMNYLYEDVDSAIDYAVAMNEKVRVPFYYSYGVANSSTDEYMTFCILLLVLICSFIVAPIFSADYANEADDIFRCTKYGRKQLGIAKVMTAYLLSTVLFVLCISTFIVITFSTYGWESLGASLQVFKSSIGFAPLTIGGYLLSIAVAGLLSSLAVISFVLFLSSKSKNSLIVLGIAVTVILLPTIINIAGAGGNIENWLKLCLPSGGIGFGNGMLYELLDLNFVSVGSFAIWSPYVIILAAIIEIPLFTYLTVKTYIRHEVSN